MHPTQKIISSNALCRRRRLRRDDNNEREEEKRREDEPTTKTCDQQHTLSLSFVRFFPLLRTVFVFYFPFLCIDWIENRSQTLVTVLFDVFFSYHFLFLHPFLLKTHGKKQTRNVRNKKCNAIDADADVLERADVSRVAFLHRVDSSRDLRREIV